MTWPGSMCIGTDCAAAFPFDPSLRGWYMVIAYAKPCEPLGLAAGTAWAGCWHPMGSPWLRLCSLGRERRHRGMRAAHAG